MKTGLVLGALALLALTDGANAQSANDNFSYKAPSGMFSEGTTKWQMYQFIETDAERTAAVKAGATGSTTSLSTSSSNSESYPRPGERTGSPRRPTGR